MDTEDDDYDYDYVLTVDYESDESDEFEERSSANRPLLHVNDFGVLTGLKDASRNGESVLIYDINQDAGRYLVRLEEGEEFSVKYENVRPE